MLITTQGLLYSHAIRKKNGKRQNRGCLVWAANHNVLPCSRTTADQEIPMRSVNHTFCIFAICVLVFSYFLNVSFAVLLSSLARETSHNCIHCNLRSYSNYCSRWAVSLNDKITFVFQIIWSYHDKSICALQYLTRYPCSRRIMIISLKILILACIRKQHVETLIIFSLTVMENLLHEFKIISVLMAHTDGITMQRAQSKDLFC